MTARMIAWLHGVLFSSVSQGAKGWPCDRPGKLYWTDEMRCRWIRQGGGLISLVLSHEGNEVMDQIDEDGVR